MDKCMVCNLSNGDVQQRNLVAACSACGSFFRNNHEHGHLLICKTGLHNCFNDEVLNLNQSKSIVCSNGKTWRFACSRCRFDKCVKVGMRVIRRNFKNRPSLCQDRKASVSDSLPSSVELSIPLDDNHLFEIEMNSIVNNWQNWFHEFTNAAPGYSRKCSSQGDVLKLFNDNVQSNAEQFSIFLKNTAEFSQLSSKEHCQSFTIGLGKLTLLNLALVDKPMAASEETIQIALGMPYLFIKEKQGWIKEIRSVFKSLNVNPAELAFVSYFLYFDNLGNCQH